LNRNSGMADAETDNSNYPTSGFVNARHTL
jgi:hypothetical protein